MRGGDISPSPVNPDTAYSAVFVLPIHYMLERTKDVYEAARRSWIVSQKFRDLPESLAVGIAAGWTSVGVFEINAWRRDSNLGKPKWEFDGITLSDDHPLALKNWRKVIDAAIVHWKYGNYMIVEFDGKGRFRVLKGSTNRTWHQL